MGQARSKLKIFNSLSQSLGLSRGSQETDTAGQALFRVRSGSLDSISTAVSFGTGQQQQQRAHSSSSLDNLHQPLQYATSSGPQRCEEGGNTYTLLATTAAADSGSLASGSDRETVEVGRGRGRRGRSDLSQSLPVEVERAVGMQPAASSSHSHSKKQPDSDSKKQFDSHSKKRFHVSRSQSMRQRKEQDSFSDNFIPTLEAKLLAEKQLRFHGDDPPKSILKASQELQEAATKLAAMAGLPSIQAPALLEKLTPEDLNDFISYVCATLGHSLHSSLEEKLQQQQQQQPTEVLTSSSSSSSSSSSRSPHHPNTGTISTAATAKHVSINEEGVEDREREALEQAEGHRSRGGGGGGGTPVVINKTRSDDRVLRRRRRRPRKERPNSLPSLWLKSDVVAVGDPPRETPGGGCPEETGEQSNEGESGGGSTTTQQPSHSTGRQRCQSESHHHHPHHRNRRRKAARSKDAPVDVSLDDNCPGLPENRVRRSRYHHHHHHAVCEQCLLQQQQKEEDGGGERRNDAPEDGGSPPANGRKEKDTALKRNKPGCVLTLEDMKTAALILQKSAGCIEDDIQARLQTYGLHSNSSKKQQHGGHVQRTSKNKQRLVHSEELVAVLVRHEPPKTPPPSKDEVNALPPPIVDSGGSNGTFWNDLAFPPRSRSGRDSPATDMAVANLDLNSTKMREPMATVSDSYLNNLRPSGAGLKCSDGQTVKHLYLHNHHHFHHIIHHSPS